MKELIEKTDAFIAQHVVELYIAVVIIEAVIITVITFSS